VKGMPQTDVFKLDKDKRDNVICEMSWTNRLSNSKDLLVLTLHCKKNRFFCKIGREEKNE
ncbi:hypothetical protein IKE96_03770, partial [bacterium]|nr:hypothetical protein [bacterium]